MVIHHLNHLKRLVRFGSISGKKPKLTREQRTALEGEFSRMRGAESAILSGGSEKAVPPEYKPGLERVRERMREIERELGE